MKSIRYITYFQERIVVTSNNITYSYKQLLYASKNIASKKLNDKNDLGEAQNVSLAPLSFEYFSIQRGICSARVKTRLVDENNQKTYAHL